MNAYRSPAAPDLPFHEYVRQSLAGSSSDVEVFPTADRLAKLRVQIGGEGPIVLVDDTVMRSCKAGLLLTTHALYTLNDGRRLDLSLVTGGPFYPDGDDEAGYIETTQGPFSFTPFTQSETRAALERLIEIVVAWSRGDRVGRYAELAMRGPISSAAAQVLLSSPHVLPPWNVNRKKREGLRVFARGMDYLGGEEVLAVIDETALGKCDEGVVFTDRALYVRCEAASAPDDTFAVPYAYLMNVTAKSGILGRKVILATSFGPREISLISKTKAADAVHRFLMGVLQVPPAARLEPRPASAPMSVDPLLTARVEALGLAAEVAADLRARLFVQEKNERWGRGGNQGWSMSPLSLADLRAAVPYVLGAPHAEHWDGRVLTLDFTLRQDGSGAGGALASSAVGVALLATVGIGWISVPKGPTIHNVRLRAYEMGGGSGIRVTGLGAVEIEAPEIANTVDTKLVSLEREILHRRCLLGLDMPATALLSVDDGALAARGHEIGMRARSAPVA